MLQYTEHRRRTRNLSLFSVFIPIQDLQPSDLAVRDFEAVLIRASRTERVILHTNHSSCSCTAEGDIESSTV